MRNIIILTLLSLVVTVSACSSDSSEPLDLYGTYELTESNDTSSYTTRAVISEDNLITVSILMDSGGQVFDQVYWIGSFTPPKNSKEPYSWVSKLDQKALADNPDATPFNVDELEFTYENNELSYTWDSGGDMGDSTATITLTRVN